MKMNLRGMAKHMYSRVITAMAADEAAKELEERAAAIVERKLRKIDHITAVAFLAEYISRKRKEIETPKPTTPATMNELNVVEFPDLSHAGQCVYLCLMNTAEIYERYTVKAINRIVKAIKAGEYVSDNCEQLTKDIQEITPAINAAVRLVKKYDHLTPSAKDIEQVTRNYIDYIIECAEYEIKNA